MNEARPKRSGDTHDRADPGSALVVLLVACAIAALWASVTIGVRQAQEKDRQVARENAAQLAELLEGEIARSIDVAVATLERAADAIGQPGQFGHIQRVLREAEWSHPEITSFAYFDASGRAHVSTVDAIHALDGHRSESFIHHRDRSARAIHLGLPDGNPVDGEQRIAVTRRLEAPDGSFAGAVGVTLRYEYFHEMLAHARQGPNGTAALHRTDRHLVAHIPHTLPPVGRSSVDADLWKHFPDANDGVFDTRESPSDREPRIVAFRKVRNFALIVVVTLALEDLAARGDAIAALPYRAAAGASLALAGIGIVGIIAMRRLHRVRRTAERQRRIADLDRIEAETARVEAQREHERAELASRAKSRFLANMSHELRTPLNAVIGFAETIRGGYVEPVGPRTREYSGHILDSGQHLLSLVDDLLDLTQFEIAEKKLELEPLDVRALADTAAARMSFQFAQRRVALEVAGGDGMQVALNRRALLQILLNLLANALRFSPVDGRVQVVIARTAAGTDISVADDGPGMSADMIARIGEPFLQNTNPMTASKTGTGLGLAIVKSLVERQGGTLHVTAEPGRGTVFRMRFAQPPDGPDSEAAPDTAKIAS